MTPTTKKHLTAIESGSVTKSNVIGLRKAFNHRARLAQGLSGNRCNVTRAEADSLSRALETNAPRVAGELDESGRKLLLSRRHAKRLAPVADILADLAGFRLVGFYWTDSLHCTPIYRAESNDGRSFDFINQSWQSGGNGPEIIA